MTGPSQRAMPRAQERWAQWRQNMHLALHWESPQGSKPSRPLLRRLEVGPVAPIRPNSSPPIAAVAADAGESCLMFSSMRLHCLRVADSAGAVYFQVCIPYAPSIEDTVRNFLRSHDRVGRLLDYLGLDWREWLASSDRAIGFEGLWSLLREFLEWGALLRLALDRAPRLILRDGLLRSVQLPERVFAAFRDKLECAIRANGHLLVGVAKRSATLSYLEPAFALTEVFPPDRCAAARVPPDLEREATPSFYRWWQGRTMGDLYVARLDDLPGSPLRAVDVARVCQAQADTALAQVAACSRRSFPLRAYPQPLADAHRHACLTALETELLDKLFLDELAAKDPAGVREMYRWRMERRMDDGWSEPAFAEGIGFGAF